MRITNKIMQRNSLNNINSNKVLQDNLTTQMSTQKKINRASDDPVIAIRALRLRSNVTEVTQYYSKNIPDADSWLQVTEDALKNTSSIVTKMIEQATRGSNGDLTSDDRKIIIEQLKALGDEVYKTGDASYAGRYVFTGYRTDTSLSFQKASKNVTYQLTEQLDKTALDSFTYVNSSAIDGWTAANFNTGTMSSVNESQIETTECYRLRLAYNDVDGKADGSGTYLDALQDITYTDNEGKTHTIKKTPSLSYYEYDEVDAEYKEKTVDVKKSGLSTDPTIYQVGDDEMNLITDTGELIIGKNLYAKLMSTKDDPTTAGITEGEIKVNYSKTNFEATDLRPEHYYACKATEWETDASGANTDTVYKDIMYNADYLKGIVDKQSIEYDVGFNQTIRINSTADESYNLGIGREVDDLVAALQKVQNLEAVKSNIETKIAETSNELALNTLQNQLVAAEKALTYEKDVCQKRFEKGITSFQKYLDDTSLAITNVGTRSSKLELIQSRMQNQKTTFETLRSENEDIDITEVAIQLSSSEMTYQAALTATGKIIQNTLLNYI
jgi:flagellar hook-associated protein 3 FlgL